MLSFRCPKALRKRYTTLPGRIIAMSSTSLLRKWRRFGFADGSVPSEFRSTRAMS